jgi:putative ABC transport system permease protein
MRWHHRLYVMLRGWFGSASLDRELDEELRFHFDREVEHHLGGGLTEAQARRAAAIALGSFDPIREASRDGRTGAWLRQFGRDLSYGTRLLVKAPAFSIAAIAIIALGIGSVTAIFSVVYGIAIKPLPFREPDRLVNLWTYAPKFGQPQILVNGADHRDWVAANSVFDGNALIRNIANFNLLANGEPERVFAARVSSNLFPILGVSPALGRTFTEDEDEIGRDNEVLLSDGLWRRRFGADPAIVGSTIQLSGVAHLVVGVMRPDFQYPGREFQLWVPLTINPRELTRQEPGYSFTAIARLKDGVSIEQAQAQMTAIAEGLALAHPKTNAGIGVTVVGTHRDLIGPVAPALSLMLGAVICLLLVACFNLSNLLSARAATRGREFAVRLALGAGRARVGLQAVAEIIPVLAIGGALGVGAAAAAITSFVPIAPATLPRVESIHVSGAILAVSMLVLAVTGILASLLPVIQVSRTDITTATRNETRSIAGGRRQARARSVLVAAQVALALPLLVGAALLARSFSNVASIDPGFTTAGVQSLLMAVPRSKYTDDDKVAAVTDRFVSQVAALPDVASAGAVSRLPLSGGAAIGYLEFEASPFEAQATTTFDWRTATPDYFETMGIPLIDGRTFNERDTATAPPVGIIDERIARLAWPGQSAIGRRFRIPVEGQPWVEVIGIVGHVRHDGLDQDRRAQVYWNHLQRAQDRLALVVKPKPGAQVGMAEIINAIHRVDPEQPVYDVRPLEDVVRSSLSGRWLNTTLLVTFALMSLVLSCIGLYGVVAFGVAQQTREFGVRLALGASRNGIAAFVVRRGVTMAAAGAGVGLVLAIMLARALNGMLFGVGTLDAASFMLATAALLAVTLVASYLPARRAASVDPAATLRAD